ncbi:unnamed protein product [Arabis nemorensis]|uniref:Uncharacterized protein n=1 Tax=Arabis nemorensis TaxID=586526 RepID=A0A565AUL8_9BRAS|nr:unnamed protein product [Arabis nemorensis]
MEPREHRAVDVDGLRRKLAELTHKLRSRDADSFPFEERREMIAFLTWEVVRGALAIHRNPKNEDLLRSALSDVNNLMVELVMGKFA